MSLQGSFVSLCGLLCPLNFNAYIRFNVLNINIIHSIEYSRIIYCYLQHVRNIVLLTEPFNIFFQENVSKYGIYPNRVVSVIQLYQRCCHGDKNPMLFIIYPVEWIMPGRRFKYLFTMCGLILSGLYANF